MILWWPLDDRTFIYVRWSAVGKVLNESYLNCKRQPNRFSISLLKFVLKDCCWLIPQSKLEWVAQAMQFSVIRHVCFPKKASWGKVQFILWVHCCGYFQFLTCHALLHTVPMWRWSSWYRFRALLPVLTAVPYWLVIGRLVGYWSRNSRWGWESKNRFEEWSRSREILHCRASGTVSSPTGPQENSDQK